MGFSFKNVVLSRKSKRRDLDFGGTRAIADKGYFSRPATLFSEDKGEQQSCSFRSKWHWGTDRSNIATTTSAVGSQHSCFTC